MNQSGMNAFTAKNLTHFYNRDTQTLRVSLEFRNTHSEPVFLVTNAKTFPAESSTGDAMLNVEQSDEMLVLDLAHPRITARSRSVVDGYRDFISGTTAIGPQESMELTFAFQFPMRLSYLCSDTDRVPTPEGVKQIQSAFWLGGW